MALENKHMDAEGTPRPPHDPHFNDEALDLLNRMGMPSGASQGGNLDQMQNEEIKILLAKIIVELQKQNK